MRSNEGGYLFALNRSRSECGTGWRCPLEQVFMIRNGNLVRVGEVLAGLEGRPGAYFRNGYFQDVYPKLEAELSKPR